MTSFSIMGMSITPSDGTGTPTVTALNKIIGLSLCRLCWNIGIN